jgi:hypothetical protein
MEKKIKGKKEWSISGLGFITLEFGRMEGAVFRVRFGAYLLGKNWISEEGSEMCSCSCGFCVSREEETEVSSFSFGNPNFSIQCNQEQSFSCF